MKQKFCFGIFVIHSYVEEERGRGEKMQMNGRSSFGLRRKKGSERKMDG